MVLTSSIRLCSSKPGFPVTGKLRNNIRKQPQPNDFLCTRDFVTKFVYILFLLHNCFNSFIQSLLASGTTLKIHIKYKNVWIFLTIGILHLYLFFLQIYILFIKKITCLAQSSFSCWINYVSAEVTNYEKPSEFFLF